MEELRKAEQTQLSFMPQLTAKRKPTEKYTHRSTKPFVEVSSQDGGGVASLPSTDDTDSGPQVHERLYSDANKWRERQAHKVELERANPDPNCTFSPQVVLSAKSLKSNAQSSSMPVAETRPRFEVLYEDSKVYQRKKDLLPGAQFPVFVVVSRSCSPLSVPFLICLFFSLSNLSFRFFSCIAHRAFICEQLFVYP